MNEELTAQGAVDAGRIAFRLAAPAELLGEPRAGAASVESLPEGALLTFKQDAGAFIYVITSGEAFGYIPDTTAVHAMTWTPEVERRPDAERSVYPASPVTAREALSGFASGMENTPAVAGPGAGVQRAVRPGPLYRDDSFTLAAPLTPDERVLIYDRIGSNKTRTFVLILGFIAFTSALLLALGVIGAAYSGYDPAAEPALILQIAAFAGILAFGTGMFMYAVSPRAVLGISGAHEIAKEEEPQLFRIVENLSIGSGLPMPKVYVIEDSAPNAFATGKRPQEAVVGVTRGLLDKLEKRELEAVMAHEMSHIGNYDTRIMTAVAVLVGLVALLADLMLRFTYYGAGARPSNKGKGGGALGAALLIMAFVLVALSPIIASAMRFAMSRQREYLADSSGALLCRNPDALADALIKISADPEPLEVANKATAHLYITNPLKEHASFMNNLFATHPPVEERVKILRAM
jgi:heat shock protein HtpX